MRWQTQTTPPRQVIEAEPGGRLRLGLRDGRTITIVGPRVTGDSVTGHTAARKRGERIAVALTEVARVETRQLDVEATVANTAIGVLVIAVLWYGGWTLFFVLK